MRRPFRPLPWGRALPAVALPLVLLTGCAGLAPEDNPAVVFENSQNGNVGGFTPQELKDGASQYQTDLSGIDGLDGIDGTSPEHPAPVPAAPVP